MNLAESRVLVTGGSGFVGRHLVARLRETGCRSLSAPTHEECDLLKSEDVRRALERLRPDLVVHLAARVGGIGANLLHPAEYFYENLMMGVPLMHEAWRTGVKKFIAVGTVCAYPKHAPVPFREDDLWDGYPEETNAPYGLAKKMLLVQAQAYRKQYGFNAIYLLPVNLYGPGDHFGPGGSHVIPALVWRFVEARESGADEVVVWGDGTATREFLYVSDAVEGILAAAERHDGAGPVNLGTGVETPIRDLAALVARLAGYEGRIAWDASRPGGQPRRRLDASRAERLLGWRARTPLEDGLRATMDWFLARRQV